MTQSRESIALRIATEHLKQLGFPWERAETSFVQKRWWGLLGADAFLFDLIGEAGWAEVWVAHPGRVPYCELYPVDGRFLMAPLWIQFPEFTSVTIHWRMAPGERYHLHWHWWFRRLTREQRLNYEKQFPAPTDDRGWSGFYDLLDITSNIT